MIEILQQRLNCGKEKAAIIEQDLLELSSELKPLLEKWLKEGNCDDATIYHGYSLSGLIRDYGMFFTGALLTLDWIIKEPDEALKELSMPIL